ncbi:unnamed protein product [Owenia fusiformis]|uniref:Uncharacterized protein n=1 Tax=Owenia fusiformis TaxID=6347 RepID=A0A8J1XU02_OWEFU|nr:unnamed protein product [Owenia fusiformis]
MDLKCIVICLIASSLQKALAQDPRVVIKDTTPKTVFDSVGNGELTAHLNTDITMACVVENLPIGTNVNWKKIEKDAAGNDDPKQISIGQSVKVDNNRIKIESPTIFTWKLKIEQALFTDEGIYVCYVKAGDAINEVNDQRTIVVRQPPIIDVNKLTSRAKEVEEGSEFETMCTAIGTPEPVITWTRIGGARLPNGGTSLQQPLFQILETKAEDRGIYICTADNGIGRSQQRIELKVSFRPKIVFDNLRSTDVYQAVGYRTVIRCSISANPAVTAETCTWSDAKGNIIDGSDGRRTTKYGVGANDKYSYELIISQVAESDYGQYKCTATNKRGTTFETVRLMKSDTPQADGKTGQVQAASSIHISIVTIIMGATVAMLHLF